MKTRVVVEAVAVLACLTWSAMAQGSEVDDKLRELDAKLSEVERRVQDLESMRRELEAERAAVRAERERLEQDAESRAGRRDDEGAEVAYGLPAWMERFHLSGNADVVLWYGEENSRKEDLHVEIDNARLFLDVDLGRDLRWGRRLVADGASFYIEWDLYRYGHFFNRIGSMYARFDRLLDVPELNTKLGRMPIPFGEEYLRFHEARPENPLISFSAAAPYYWDEGLLLFGAIRGVPIEYLVSVMDGEEDDVVNSDVQVTAKVIYTPRRWARLSASGMRTGRLGGGSTPAESAMKFGGVHVRPFGFDTDVPNFRNGVAIADDPAPTIDDVQAAEFDLTLSNDAWGRLWLSYGLLGIESGGSSVYDRDLSYGVAEGVLELGALARALEKTYLATRYSVYGTFDSDEGYVLDVLNGGRDLGFNAKAVSIVSIGAGVRLSRSIVVKSEYSWFDFDLVRGVSDAIRKDARDRDFWGLDVSVRF